VADLGAAGDGSTDDTWAFRAALGVLGPAGTLYCPPGTFKLSRSLIPDKPVTIQGAGMGAGAGTATVLWFSQPGTGIRLRHASQTGGRGDAESSCVRDLTLLGVRWPIAEWQPGHVYSAGDLVRSRLVPLSRAGDPRPGDTPPGTPWQEDSALHYRCVRNGTSGAEQPPWVPEAGVEIPDGDAGGGGGCRWIAEDWSGITISTAFCTVERCRINEVTDNGIFVAGERGAIADNAVIRQCIFSGGDGHGIFLHGADANAAMTLANAFYSYQRGAGIYDASSLSNVHIGNAVNACRRGYLSNAGTAQTVWIANYTESDSGPLLVPGSHLWLSGQTSESAAPESTGLRFEGKAWWGPLKVTFKQPNKPQLTRVLGGDHLDGFARVGDQVTWDEFITDDPDDPGAYFSMRWNGRPDQTARELTSERSVWGPNRFRFPQGFFLGRNGNELRQLWITTFPRAPAADARHWVRTRLWRVGDTVLNQNVGPEEPLGWRAARQGGWGGGRHYDARAWMPGAGPICIGDGIEPPVANGKVYRLKEFQVRDTPTSVWRRDDRLTANLSAGGPADGWPPDDDAQVFEDLDDTHRIEWQCWGDVGMTWAEMPAPARLFDV
jgi:hypothetical protein